MKEELSITNERIDDFVVLLRLMQEMDLPGILDRHLPRHWLQQGLSWGWTASIWLAHIVSQGDHRKLTVRDWVRQAHSTLEQVSGEQADDRLYVPILDRVLACLGRQGLLCVGDSKMSALATRAHLQAHAQYYLTPLALVGETAQQMPDWIRAGVARGDALTQVPSDDEKQVLAQGYEVSRTCVCEGLTWQERVLVVRSHAYAQMQRRHLEERLEKAQTALLALTPPVGRGKRQITEETTLQSAAEAVLAKHRVVGLLTYTSARQSEQTVTFVGRGRGGANRQQQVSERVRYQVTAVERNEEAIADLVSTLGWRAYATNAPPKRLSLGNAVREYRHEYHIEQGFGRLKGAPLSIAPMFVKRDDQVTGLTHLLSLALRVLTLMEFVVRRSLHQQGATLAGLYKDNPRRVTATPTAERLLQAFVPITFTQVQLPDQTIRHVTPLTLVQEQILRLL